MKPITINPVTAVGEERYAEIWQTLFATLLHGFWARGIFLALIAISIFYSVRRRNPRVAIISLVLAVVVAYGAAIVGKMFGV